MGLAAPHLCLTTIVTSVSSLIAAVFICRTFRWLRRNPFTMLIFELALTQNFSKHIGRSLPWLVVVRSSVAGLIRKLFGYYFLPNIAGLERFMGQPHHVLNVEPVLYAFYTRVLGLEDGPQLREKLKLSWEALGKHVEESFVAESASTSMLERANVFERAVSFVSFASRSADLRRWELSANVSLDDGGEVVRADLYSLTRNFGACIAVPLLYGHDFVDQYPELLQDLWSLDDSLPLFMMGVPSWVPLSVVRKGMGARKRLISRLDELGQRIDQYHSGRAVDADLSDVSATVLRRSEVLREHEWPGRERGGGELALLWGQNANLQPTLFWFLLFVYSTPGLVREIRDEVESCTGASDDGIEAIHLPSLFSSCPLLRACVLETLRMVTASPVIRYVEQDTTFYGNKYQHNLRSGGFLYAPTFVDQQDPSVYANPDTFDPYRFLHRENESGRLVTRPGKLRPFGMGLGMCKGRSFAQKFLLVCVAAIVRKWDIRPADGEWKVPSMIPGAPASKPKQDVRVAITHRVHR